MSYQGMRRKYHGKILVNILFFTLSLLWFEGLFRSFYVRPFWSGHLGYILLFSLSTGVLLSIISSLFHSGWNKFTAFFLLSFLTFNLIFQGLVMNNTTEFLILDEISSLYPSVTFLLGEIFSGNFSALPFILLSCAPIGIFLGWRKTLVVSQTPDGSVLIPLVILGVGLHFLAVFILNLPSDQLIPSDFYYRQSFLPQESVEHFGLFTTQRLDLTQTLFGLRTN